MLVRLILISIQLYSDGFCNKQNRTFSKYFQEMMNKSLAVAT